MVELETKAKTRSYTGVRAEVLALVDARHQKVLDVGCATGALGAALKSRQGAWVVGIEYDDRTASVAADVLDRVVAGDLNDWSGLASRLPTDCYDCIVCADVLEHLLDPWSTVRELVALLEEGGDLIISLPNVGHHNTLWNVFVRRRWPRRDRGLHDVTHLRWFGRQDVRELVETAGLDLVEMRRNYRLREAPHWMNRFAKYLALPGLRDLLTYQFLVRATRARSSGAGTASVVA